MFSWYSALTLMIDAMQVIDMRIKLIATGKVHPKRCSSW